jgi:integrative and conjugative element protein (TIGR02256 family)
MIPKGIFIKPAVLAIVKQEMAKASATETGGVLVGYLHNGELVVTGASGPGPRAKLEKYGVLIDGKYAQRFCDQARRSSSGRDDYVGDWHCHPGRSLKPSHWDHDAMATMAEFGASPTTQPVSLIWSKVSGRVRGFYYDSASEKLRRTKIRGVPAGKLFQKVLRKVRRKVLERHV